jgi:2-succinyl-6-hydroxy-2,4-cyclohexadiene-1-carboxylate synthase
MGGRLALKTTLEVKEKVNGLILESSSAGICDSAERYARALKDKALANKIEREGLDWFSRYWASQDIFDSQKNLSPQKERQLTRQRIQNRASSLAHSLRGFGQGTAGNEWGRLNELDIPVLLISGEKDKTYGETMDRMSVLMRYAKRVEIKSAGHNTHLEKPNIFNKLVNEFCNHLDRQ